MSDVIHRCPPTGWSDKMPCCGKSPGEVMADRITTQDDLVTCGRGPRELMALLEQWETVQPHGMMSRRRAAAIIRQTLGGTP